MGRTFVILVLKFELTSHQGHSVEELWQKKKRHNFKLFEISQFKIMPVTTGRDVFNFQVLNYLKLSSNWSVIEPCPFGSWYYQVCQMCYPELFKQTYFEFIPKSANILKITSGGRNVRYAHHICMDITLVAYLHISFCKD